MANEVVKILEKKGPLVSSDIIEYLESKEIKRATARQKIHRSLKNEEIKVIEDFNLINNKKLYALNSHLKQGNNSNRELKLNQLDQAIYSLSKNDNILSTLFVELKKKNFLILDDLYKVLPMPIKYVSGNDRRNFADLFNSLKKLGMLTSSTIDNKKYIHEYKLLKYKLSDVEKRSNQITQEQILIRNIVKIFEKNTLIGWNSSIFSSDEKKIDYYGYYFDSIATSYTFNTKQGIDNGVKVLFTFSFDEKRTSSEVKALKIKIQNISKKNNKIIPVFIYKKISTKDFSSLKKIGVVCISLNSIFNRTDLTDIELFINFNVNSLITEDGQAEKTAMQLIKTTGQVNNLNGYLFNYIMAFVFSKLLNTDRIVVGKKFTLEEKSCECDILIDLDNSIVIFETKKYKAPIKLGTDENEKNSVKYFFKRTKNIVERNYKNDNNPELSKKVIPVYITTSIFEENAKIFMDDQKKSIQLLEEDNPTLYNLLSNKLYIDKENLIQMLSSKKIGSEISQLLKKIINDKDV